MSSNDKDWLEEEFLNNCNIDDIPVPKTYQIVEYEKEVLEVMKSGCNRQIAEYVIIKYKEQEEKEIKYKEQEEKDNTTTLKDLCKKYREKINDIIEKAKIDFISSKNIQNASDKKNLEEIEKKLEGFENEIEEIMQCREEEDNNQEVLEMQAKICLYNELKKKEEKEMKEINDLKKQYYDKRDAVIEAALRKVKKIVNNDDEFKKFYKDYYGKDYKEDKDDKKDENKK